MERAVQTVQKIFEFSHDLEIRLLGLFEKAYLQFRQQDKPEKQLVVMKVRFGSEYVPLSFFCGLHLLGDSFVRVHQSAVGIWRLLPGVLFSF